MTSEFKNFIENEYSKIGIKDISILKENVQNVFSKYLVNRQRTLKLYMDLLFLEFIKYNKIKKSSKFFIFFESEILNYKNLKDRYQKDFLNLMKIMFEINEEAGNNYMSICFNQHYINNFSKYNDLDNMMKMMGDLLEECLYRNLRLLYGFIFFMKNLIIPPNLFDINFGGLIIELKKYLSDPTFLNDYIYNIPLNQLRNICKHKTYKLINDQEIQVEYGSNKKKIVIIKYDDILKLLKNINLFNTTITLIFNLIYLDIIPDIHQDLNYDNIRLENSFSSLFYSLRYLNYKIIKYGLNTKNNIFEMCFEDVDNIDNTLNRIILISQNFSRIAKYIYDDKILNISPDAIKISLIYNNMEIANAIISYDHALNYIMKKNDIVELINNIEFNIINNKK